MAGEGPAGSGEVWTKYLDPGHQRGRAGGQQPTFPQMPKEEKIQQNLVLSRWACVVCLVFSAILYIVSV